MGRSYATGTAARIGGEDALPACIIVDPGAAGRASRARRRAPAPTRDV